MEEQDQSVLDKVLGRNAEEPATESAVEETPVVVEAGECVNCANQGDKSKLGKDGVCDKCGFKA